MASTSGSAAATRRTRERVAELGGLYVIGSGRHDSRRVDDQLRGRAGRQGDPGGSVFFVSLEDDLVVRHAGDLIPSSPRMDMDGVVHDDTVDYAVEHAQRVAEGVNHEIHRNTWRYSVVIEQQRKALAERRERLLTTEVAAIMLLEKSPEKAKEIDEDVLLRGGPRRSPCTTSTGCGPSTWPSCPRCARACTCGRWASSTRSTSSTGRRCRRSRSSSPRSRRGPSPRSRRPT